MFQPVSSKVDFPKLEEKILGLWKEHGIFEKSVTSREGKPRFVFYEGPPFANGNPGIHHVLARAYKDVIVRYKVMKGFYVPRVAGWDTHGLPVELEVEKALGFSGKDQIEEYGVEQFNQRARESVFKYLKEWNILTERIAYWVDLEHAYKTMDNTYVESVWWALKQMWDKGLVYQGYKVTPHCPRCGTSLSSHEVALGYQDDTEDPSVYIKFIIAGKSVGSFKLDKPAYLLAWTTTPWTLPGNTALAVAAEAEYAVVEVDGEYIVLADARRNAIGLGESAVLARIRGKELVGVEYEPLFNPHDYGIERRRFENRTELAAQKPDKNLKYHVITTDFVSMEDGTGIVHVAPAYGEVDFQAGQDFKLDLVHNVDLQGKITGNFSFSGKFVKAADPLITKNLKDRNLLYRSETIKHTYPFCWRCDAPLLYYAKQTWYIRTTAVKDRLISGNAEINWYPQHIKYGRFGNWLENNVDWAFARERYWGSPLPIWCCEKCGSFECIGSVAELEAKPGFTGLREPLDLHRPFVDEVSFACSKCGGKMRRQPEVIDCWFDSGSMPFAQLHYPLENKNLFDTEAKQADFICEGVDQTRGWFYSLHAVSTMLFDRPSFKNCICLELVLDAEGKKMSKSRGNVVDPMKVVQTHGADALRWYCFTSAPPGMVRRFDTRMVQDITRQFLLTLWNVYSFFVTYANIDNFVPGSAPAPSVRPELDRWILSELNQLIDDVTNGNDNYDPTGAGRKLETFVDNLSNWYVRRSRRRFWKSENDTDKLSAYNTLYECLVTLAKLMAPFTPFLAEELYQNLVRSVSADAPESVHLTDFPVAARDKIDQELTEANRTAMKVSSLGRAARSKAGIKVRQPLQVCYFDTSFRRALESEAIRQAVLDELNVKEIRFETPERLAELAEKTGCVVDDKIAPSTAIDATLTAELEAEGMAREIVHRIQGMRRSADFEIADHIITYYEGDDYVRQVMKNTALAEYISLETLSHELTEGLPADVDYKEAFKLGGHEVTLGVKRQSA
ncbi:MAG: isoleucine--tRNA ligase [Chloroflexi bacterium]|nr:isoleucine--tRNA ligase [Chloroflexota bacterium]